MIDADLYIACLILTERRALVVGTGAMADEKVEGLQTCGAEVTRVDPDDYDVKLLEGNVLVVATTGDGDLSRKIAADAEARSMLVNVADVPRLCNFILPAVLRHGPLTVGVSTAGASPALAKRIRREIEARIGPEYVRMAELLDELRPWAKENLDGYEARKSFFESIVDGEPDPIELLRNKDEEAVRALIEAAKERR